MSENQEYEIMVIGDAEYKTLLTDKYKHRSPYVRPKASDVTAFIPGTIREMFVKEGDKVEKGQILLILEAMKMNNRLEAPMTGVVKQMLVKTGDIVSKNQILVVVK
ncbi:MAG: acetyl-CoA carboxylase biotin carboxyl carrier protein subunit [Bacteroidales bacterium]|nr:acetyl-CoA carboxylase biotin carboxyl carrier protein subunit [Bacteroidales bacterium]